MFDTILSGTSIAPWAFFVCTAISMLLGMGIAGLCMYKSQYTQSFVLSLAMLPCVVQVVIMLVNGNIGAGLAVAGTFSLIRYRSAAGTAREIAFVFLAMAIGLITGMGYAVLALIFFLVVAAFCLLLTLCRFGQGESQARELKITIPENLDYEGLFDDILKVYTKSYGLEKVKTTNMGSLYELSYRIVLKDGVMPKAFMDALRCRNGNLNIVCGRVITRDTL